MPLDKYRITLASLELQDREDMVLDALAASGDLFITLATQLDEASADPEHYSAKLQELTRILLYMQRNYKVVRQQPNYRQ